MKIKMPVRLPVRPVLPQNLPQTGASEEKSFNLRLFAKKLLAWAAHWFGEVEGGKRRQYGLRRKSAGMSAREWLRKLTPENFEVLLGALYMDLMDLDDIATASAFSDPDPAIATLLTDKELVQELGRLTNPSIEANFRKIEKVFQAWHTSKPSSGGPMLDYGKSFVQDSVRYFPLSAAVSVVQAPPPTILNWIKNDTTFNGEPLQSLYFAPANQYFISEESIERAANRFIKWLNEKPPGEPAGPGGPAGPVTLGHTKDKSGFIALSEAERILGVSKRTMYLWATQGKAPSDKQPEVIQCPSSEHFYIREKDVYSLKKLIPRSGLPRGRRRQLATPHL
jgi:hypothetical protein